MKTLKTEQDVQIHRRLTKLSDHYCDIRNLLQDMVGGGRSENWGCEDLAITQQRERLADLLKEHLEVVEEYEWGINYALETQFKNFKASRP